MWDQIENVFFTQVLKTWIRAIVTGRASGPGLSMSQMIWKFPLLCMFPLLTGEVWTEMSMVGST